ncbi:RNA polymerase sigma factor [Actinomycetospora sp. CA-101289]|uniref:RNA polymerase sigma factor n=1 Tax=Actinomycetospora sp. CA-101289 TaxID=3239893 RepID=UPI003D962208
MAKAFHRWSTLTAPRAWARTVATRLWLKQQFGSREAPGVEGEVGQDGRLLITATSSELDDLIARHDFLHRIAILPPRQRQILIRSFDGETPAEIADALDMPAETVRSNLRHARKAMQCRVRREGGELQ